MPFRSLTRCLYRCCCANLVTQTPALSLAPPRSFLKHSTKTSMMPVKFTCANACGASSFACASLRPAKSSARLPRTLDRRLPSSSGATCSFGWTSDANLIKLSTIVSKVGIWAISSAVDPSVISTMRGPALTNLSKHPGAFVRSNVRMRTAASKLVRSSPPLSLALTRDSTILDKDCNSNASDLTGKLDGSEPTSLPTRSKARVGTSASLPLVSEMSGATKSNNPHVKASVAATGRTASRFTKAPNN
mmetsp:Transcript_44879/g.81889  ORF Transcript_44879/g.81889 Transcript_44879/m.81889 type:complete len:247 (+) Transcript_44879:233-973(+)